MARSMSVVAARARCAKGSGRAATCNGIRRRPRAPGIRIGSARARRTLKALFARMTLDRSILWHPSKSREPFLRVFRERPAELQVFAVVLDGVRPIVLVRHPRSQLLHVPARPVVAHFQRPPEIEIARRLVRRRGYSVLKRLHRILEGPDV